MFENNKGLDTSTWQPALKLWMETVRDHPQHRLGGPQSEACSRFIGRHKGALHKAGIIVRLPATRGWLADPQEFPRAVLLLATGAKLSPAAKSASPKRRRAPKTTGAGRRADRSAAAGVSIS